MKPAAGVIFFVSPGEDGPDDNTPRGIDFPCLTREDPPRGSLI